MKKLTNKLKTFPFQIFTFFLHHVTNQESDGEMQEAGGVEGEEKGKGEKSQKGGQHKDSLPFLIRSQLMEIYF